MVDPKKLSQEMTPKEYENFTGQKKPADQRIPSPPSGAMTQPESKVDDELGPYGGDSAELHD